MVSGARQLDVITALLRKPPKKPPTTLAVVDGSPRAWHKDAHGHLQEPCKVPACRGVWRRSQTFLPG